MGGDEAQALMAEVNAAFAANDIAGARPHLERLAELLPDNGQVWRSLGQACLAAEDMAAAERAFRAAVDLDDDDARALDGLGIVLHRKGDLEGAEALHVQAIDIDPDLASAWVNRGIALTDLGRCDEAAAVLEQALVLDPRNAKSRFNLAIVDLLRGNHLRGWDLYEARLEIPGFQPPPGRRWTGEALKGERVLLVPEQGFGDIIQFARFLPEVAARGGTPVLALPPQMMRLMAAQDWSAIYATDDAPPQTPCWCPLMSLGGALGIDAGLIGGAPYMRADGTAWTPRLPEGRKVGLAWAGNPTHRRDRARSIPSARLTPLLDVPDTTFVILQVGRRDGDAESLAGRANVIDPVADLTDFFDTAALMTDLDLVISTDTVILHLAGALGVPAWGLLPFAPDWRWGMSGDRTTWYDSLRLYRQPALGDWAAVVEKVAADLRRI